MAARTRKRPRLTVEKRPAATTAEVYAALVQGQILGLLSAKSVSLQVGEAALRQAREFLRLDESEVKDDRLKHLVGHIERERERERRQTINATDAFAPRRAGQTVRYKAQRNGQRKAAFARTPLGTIDPEGTLEEYDTFFAPPSTQYPHGAIVITPVVKK